MPIVRLGKMPLKWCHRCNMPILELVRCPRCGGDTVQVKLTPPGDVRPAFDFDLEHIRGQVDAQFGEGAGEAFLPIGSLVVLNKVPYIDRMDEIVMDGEVQGAVRYVLGRGFQVVLRPVAARRMSGALSRGWVVADRGAIPSILRSSNLLAPGVNDASDGIEVGDEVVLLSPERVPIATGSARMSSHQMRGGKGRGVAVKVRWREEPASRPPGDRGPRPTWEEAVEANREVIEKRVQKATRFIRKLQGEGLPIVVSYSGGKDSLASLLLALDAGLKPTLLFANTGLEFPETLENVMETARRYELDLLVEEAGDAFWEAFPTFGPPGKDHRWCCKGCKLGPTARLIERNFPGGVLSLIGQRRYESEQRARKGRVWRNPWVPNQLGASPIQDWTAMHVWLYLFSRDARYNRLYEMGLDRIGCWLCPAQDMGEMELLREHHPDSQRWLEYLSRHSEENGLHRKWLELGLWRWRDPPESMRQLAREHGVELGTGAAGAGARLLRADRYETCSGGVSSEAALTEAPDMKRVGNLLLALGDVAVDETGACSAGMAQVFPSGAVSVQASEPGELKSALDGVEIALRRAMDCIGCGVCVAACKQDAIYIDLQAWIDPARCTHCGACLKAKCPVTEFL